MPRMLSNAPCSVCFYDKISDSRITLHYRMPTTSERIAYNNSLVTRKGIKVKSNVGETRQKFGLLILTGFEKGAFCDAAGNVIASEASEPGYDAAWRELVRQYAPDLVDALAVHAFETSVMRDDDDPENGDDADAADENPT